MTVDEAHTLTDKIKQRLDETWKLIAEAYKKRADRVIGYPTWDSYCKAGDCLNNGGSDLGLTRRALAWREGLTMSETLDPVATELDQRQLAEQLLAQAKEQGVELVGPNGLLNQLTKNVLETALDAQMCEHLGYDKHDPAGRGSGNSRNGTRAKTVLTEIGLVEIEVPRDTNSSFEPQIVKKRQRRLTGIDEIVLSLTAKGLTTGEVAAHFADVYGATVSKDTISRITDKVIGRDDRLVQPVAGAGVPRGVHRRYPCEDPRRAGHQSPYLRRRRAILTPISHAKNTSIARSRCSAISLWLSSTHTTIGMLTTIADVTNAQRQLAHSSRSPVERVEWRLDKPPERQFGRFVCDHFSAPTILRTPIRIAATANSIPSVARASAAIILISLLNVL